MRINPEALQVLINTGLNEITPLKQGQVLNAQVERIKDEMVLLLLNSKIPLKSRMLGKIPLEEGQVINLEVKKVSGNEITLAIVREEKYNEQEFGVNSRRPNAVLAGDTQDIEEVFIKNGPTETAKSAGEAKAVMDKVRYVFENVEKLAGFKSGSCWGVLKATINEMVDFINGNGQNTRENARAFESASIKDILAELVDAKPEDVIRLIKLNRELTPLNLILAKNIRENKGFLKPLLKVLYESEKTLDLKGQTPSNPDLGSAKKGLERIELPELLTKFLQESDAESKTGTVLQFICEKAYQIGKTLRAQNCFLIPFLFNGEPEEALIIVKNFNRQKSAASPEKDYLEMEIITNPSYLGEIRSLIKIQGKNMVCTFFAKKDQTVDLLEKYKNELDERIEEKGYKVVALSCIKQNKDVLYMKDNTFDLRV